MPGVSKAILKRRGVIAADLRHVTGNPLDAFACEELDAILADRCDVFRLAPLG
jgi:hypothetical protein